MNATDSGQSSSGVTEKYIIWGLIAILALLVAATVILASVPPVDRDALTHHLFVPKLWLQHGGIYEIPGDPVLVLPDESRPAVYDPALFRQRYRAEIYPLPFRLADGMADPPLSQ